jgi:prophage maintenance system killer protein
MLQVMSTKSLAALLYEMGVTFDNLSTTRMATEEFLRTGNPNVIGSRQDYDLLCDLKAAAHYTITYDYADQPFDLPYVQGINRQLTRTAALSPGTLRTSENVAVRLIDGRRYVPPVPDSHTLEDTIEKASSSAGSLEDAALLFASLAAAQPFGDGNKRTALLAANGLLIKKDQKHILTVPTEPQDVRTFNRLLGQWYVGESKDVVRWLADWNKSSHAQHA